MVFYKLFFFVFNLYPRRLSYTEDYFASSSALLEWKVPWEFPVAVQWAIFFCRLSFLFTESIFYFAVDISLLPWPISFLPRAVFIAAIIFLLPRKFLFCREIFSFSVTYIYFAAQIFLLASEFLFYRELFSFTVTLVGHRNCNMVKANICKPKKDNLGMYLLESAHLYINLYFKIL